MEREQVLMLTLTTVGVAAQIWGSALPERATVAGWPADPAHVGAVHGLCAQSGCAALTVGAAASLASKSWWPVLGAAAVVAYLGLAYSGAARSGSTPETPVATETSGAGRAPQRGGYRQTIRWQP